MIFDDLAGYYDSRGVYVDPVEPIQPGVAFINAPPVTTLPFAPVFSYTQPDPVSAHLIGPPVYTSPTDPYAPGSPGMPQADLYPDAGFKFPDVTAPLDWIRGVDASAGQGPVGGFDWPSVVPLVERKPDGGIGMDFPDMSLAGLDMNMLVLIMLIRRRD